MPIPTQGTIDEIYEAMAALEQPVLDLVDTEHDFTAFPYPPEPEVWPLPYPFSFRFPPRARVWDRRMRGEKPFVWVIRVIVLVAPSSNNWGPLMKEAQRYVLPFVELYEGDGIDSPNRRIPDEAGIPTVRDIEWGEIVMGDIELNSVKHFGIEFPIIAHQFRQVS